MREYFRTMSEAVASAMGTPAAFLGASFVVVVWALAGPYFHFSDTWQLVINTGTTIVTFLMVFLIQATQNRDTKILNLKIDELIRSQEGARNEFASLNDKSDEDLERVEVELKHLCGTFGELVSDDLSAVQRERQRRRQNMDLRTRVDTSR